MAITFATVADLVARWRPLSEAETTKAGVLLGDASDIIRSLYPSIDDDLLAGTLDPNIPEAIVCAMVKRAMQGPVEFDGVTQAQQTAGPFQQGVTFANPTGDIYLTKFEKRRLGIGQQRAFMVDLIPSAVEDPT